METLEKTTLAPIERDLNSPLRLSYEMIPPTAGQRSEHIENMTYSELFQFAQVAAIGHPYFDARYGYFQGSVVPHFTKLYKMQSRARRSLDFERAESLGLLKPSALRRFGRWMKKIDRAMYNASF